MESKTRLVMCVKNQFESGELAVTNKKLMLKWVHTAILDTPEHRNKEDVKKSTEKREHSVQYTDKMYAECLTIV